MAVTNWDEFRAWLEEQPREVCVAIAHRAAMRALPMAVVLDAFEGAPDSALAVFRCSLTSGVAVVRATPDVSAASASAYTSAVRSAPGATSDAAVAASADAAGAAAADTAARSASSAVAAAYAAAAASAVTASFNAAAAVYADTEVAGDLLMSTAIPVPDLIQSLHAEAAANRQSALDAGGAWAFWAKWYAAAMRGEPLSWDLQEAVALIPDEIWEAGPEAVAEEIARIEETYWTSKLPQAEEVVAQEDGLFDVRASVTADDGLIERIFNQTEFALDLSLNTNCGFSEICVGFKLIRYTLDNLRDDPNTVEQHLRMARDIISGQVASKSYDDHDAIKVLLSSLDQHALELRGQHSEVRAAYEVRVQQTLREIDDDTRVEAAAAMREFQREKTTGRLEEETGLDAEILEADSAVEAQASAVQRTGGRAAVARGLERASQTAKDVDASGGYKGARIGTTGYTIVDILLKVFGA